MVSLCQAAFMAWSSLSSNDSVRPISNLQHGPTHRHRRNMLPPFPSCSSVKHGRRSDSFAASMKKKKATSLKKESHAATAAADGGEEMKGKERTPDAEGLQEPGNAAVRAEIREKLSLLRPNAYKMKLTSASPSPASYSLGIDLGDERTGIAISKGFAPRPVEVVELKGQKLADYLIKIAEREKANEFILGLPKSASGLESKQCSKVRHFAGRLAVVAAERGWCVYLYNEFGSSCDALDYMLMMGSTKKARRTQLDAYAAVILLQSYFENDGKNVELVVPKRLSLQQLLCEGPTTVDSDDDCDFEAEDSLGL